MPTIELPAIVGAIIAEHPKRAYLVGVLVAQWNTIEESLTHLLAACMRTHWHAVYAMSLEVRGNTNRLMTMKKGFMFSKADHKIPEHTIEDVFSEAKQILEKRNHFAHGLYVNGSDVGLSIMKPQAGLLHKTSEVREEELLEYIHRSVALLDRVGRLTAEAYGPLPQSPDSES